MKKPSTAKCIRRKFSFQLILTVSVCIAATLIGVTQLNYLEMDVYFLGCIFIIPGGIAVRMWHLKADIYQALLEMSPDSTRAESYANKYYRYSMRLVKIYMAISVFSLIGMIACIVF